MRQGQSHSDGDSTGTDDRSPQRGHCLLIALKFGITAAEFAGSVVSGSHALQAEAAHNVSEAGSMPMSYMVRRISPRKTDRRRTFGSARPAMVGVSVSAIAIMIWGFTWLDPVIRALIAAYFLRHAYTKIREAIGILMDSVPKDFGNDGLVAELKVVPSVEDVHHLYVWRTNESRTALEAYVAVWESDFAAVMDLKGRFKARCKEHFRIDHATWGSSCRHGSATVANCFRTNDVEMRSPSRCSAAAHANKRAPARRIRRRPGTVESFQSYILTGQALGEGSAS